MKNKIYLDEKLTASDSTSKWISDFVKSDNPKFADKSKKERIRMALGASYAAKGKSRNEEVEELDEISKKTLGSYVSKASVDMANRSAEGERKRTLAGADYAHNISRGMSAKTAEAGMKKDREAAKPDVKKAVQRMRGIEKAVGRLAKEEAEQVEEGTYKPEVEKAFPASGVKTGASAPKGTSTMPKDKEKAKGQPAGALKKEESEQIDEVAGMYTHYVVKHPKTGEIVHHEVESNTSGNSEMENRSILRKKYPGHKVISMDHKNKKLDPKMVKEESEQIDEIGDTFAGKRALASYAKKAAGSAEIASRIASYSAKLSGHEQKPMLDIVSKRTSGVKKAVDRLAKEEVERIDEIGDTGAGKKALASYIKKATHDARMKFATGKDFERIATKSRKPAYKAAATDWEKRYKGDARRREAGIFKAADRLAKEEVEIDEATPSSQQVKQAIGIARDKRYAGGNVTGAVKVMDKINKGLAQHPVVKKELQKQNEATSAYGRINSRFKTLSGRSLGAAAKEYGDEAKRLQKEIDAQKAENERRKAAMKTEDTELEEKKKGLWDNIHAKRKRGERPARPGEKGYPKTLNIEDTELEEAGRMQGGGKDPCWKGYKMIGTKKKGGREVPNCVPTEEVKELKTFKALREEINGN